MLVRMAFHLTTLNKKLHREMHPPHTNLVATRAISRMYSVTRAPLLIGDSHSTWTTVGDRTEIFGAWG